MKALVVAAALTLSSFALADDIIYKDMNELIIYYNNNTQSCKLISDTNEYTQIHFVIQKNDKQETAFVLVFVNNNWNWLENTSIPVIITLQQNNQLITAFETVLLSSNTALGFRMTLKEVVDLAKSDKLIVASPVTLKTIMLYNTTNFDTGIKYALECFSSKYAQPGNKL